MVETEEFPPSYTIKTRSQTGELVDAYLEPATEGDMPPLDSIHWTFNWKGFWTETDLECEAIIKLSYKTEVLGLIRFGLYPYPCSSDGPEYLEILHLECISKDRRLINPVGFWLIWYALRIGLTYCEGTEEGSLITLDSIESAIPYYRDKVKMDQLRWKTMAPGEDGYAFKFTKEGAESSCKRLQREFSFPVLFR